VRGRWRLCVLLGVAGSATAAAAAAVVALIRNLCSW
jgi:hypothetical protein